MRWTNGRIHVAQYSTGMNFSFGEPGGETVADDRGHAVVHGVLVGHHRLERRRALRLERQHLAGDALPLVHVALVAGVTGVHAHDDVEALDLGPERVELGEREGLAALPGGHRRHADQEDLGTALVDVLRAPRAHGRHRPPD